MSTSYTLLAFPHHCKDKLHLRNSYPSICDACPPVLHKANYPPWWLRFPLCYTVDPSLIPCTCLEIPRCSCSLFIFPFRNIVPQHSFPLQLELRCMAIFFLRYLFQLATPPGFHVSHISKGNLVYTWYIYTTASFGDGVRIYLIIDWKMPFKKWKNCPPKKWPQIFISDYVRREGEPKSKLLGSSFRHTAEEHFSCSANASRC